MAFFMKPENDDCAAPLVSKNSNLLIRELRNAGVEVDLLVAESKVWDLSCIEHNYDLYVLKSSSSLTLSIASILSAKGASIVNSVESTQLAKDKIAAVTALAANGIVVPPSWSTGQGTLFRPLLSSGALWLKAHNGSGGKGVLRLTLESDEVLDKSSADNHGLPQPLFAQCEVPSPGFDLKVYAVGKKQWAITRPWPATSNKDKKGSSAILDEGLRASTVACGQGLGLEIYGVDYLLTDSGRYVVDVNAFPGFKGIEDAPYEIANYLLTRARESTWIGH